MKRVLTLLVISASLVSFSLPETYVYICKGPYSKKYHYKKTCRGLSNCSTDTYKVTMAEVKKLKRTLCGFEE